MCPSTHRGHFGDEWALRYAPAQSGIIVLPMTGSFPSLRISARDLEPRGAFAEAQAAFLSPDPKLVAELDELLRQKKIGIVAHYYMDPELQGVLSACTWEHIGVSDSLLMADRGIRMIEAGCEAVVVLGVDFMSENARAMLDDAGHTAPPVYRVATEEIGCSLAESAEAPAYAAYLKRAGEAKNALHVVYINTSLITKAQAHATVPTITCTSSNVLQTILQADSQVEDLKVFFGPDTYMGSNLAHMFSALAELDEAAIAELHPKHTKQSIASLAKRFDYFRQGNCVVHHMFGAEVVEEVRENYADAFVTAHLEVPGEMFALGLEKRLEGKGAVGSTSNILGFIREKIEAAIAAGDSGTLQFVLGTEAGMITPIVRTTQKLLQDAGSDLVAEIIFPVASEAVAQTGDATLPIVPGVSGGEGCSTAGGCATCPYMKMNSLDALLGLCRSVGTGEDLTAFEPRKYTELVAGRTAADLGGEAILNMRHYQQQGQLSGALVQDIQSR